MHSELQLLLLLAIIVTVSKVAGHLSRRYLNQPVVFGEILAGLLFGPTLLNLLGWPLFAPQGNHAWDLAAMVTALAHIGVLLLMFVAGLETNLAQLRTVGRTALWTAVLGVAAPLLLGAGTGAVFGLPLTESLFIGAVLTATSVSISAQTLLEIGRLNSREGATILGAAVIDDVLGIIILAFVIAFGTTQHGADAKVLGLVDQVAIPICRLCGVPSSHPLIQVLVVVLLMGLFFAGALLIGARGLGAVVRWADRLHASHIVPATALVLVFALAVAAEYVGQVAAITGAYLAGVFLAPSPYKAEIARGIHPFTYALFVPVFFMSIGLGADARQILQGHLPFVLAIVGVAILTKVVGCGLGARLTGFTTPEALRVGVGMISRGEVGLIVAQVGLSSGVIATPIYAALVIMVLVSTVITPVLLRLTFPHEREVDTPVFESVVTVETPDPSNKS